MDRRRGGNDKQRDRNWTEGAQQIAHRSRPLLQVFREDIDQGGRDAGERDQEGAAHDGRHLEIANPARAPPPVPRQTAVAVWSRRPIPTPTRTTPSTTRAAVARQLSSAATRCDSTARP